MYIHGSRSKVSIGNDYYKRLSKQTVSCNWSLDMTDPDMERAGKDTQNPSLAQGNTYPWGNEKTMDKDTLRHILPY